jgi:hypothetical protein
MVTAATFFSPPRARRRGGVAMPDLKEHRGSVNRPTAELLRELYPELRRLAASLTTRLRPGQTLQPTALVHEAYLRLMGERDPGWAGRRHFLGAAARAARDPHRAGAAQGEPQARRRGPPRRAVGGPGPNRAAGRRSTGAGRGHPATPGGEAAPRCGRPAPRLHRTGHGSDRRSRRPVSQHGHMRVALRPRPDRGRMKAEG